MFASRLKSLRQSSGLSQVELAGRLGVKKQSISNWENDNIMPSVDMLEKIADCFGVSADYLLGREQKFLEGTGLLDTTGLKPSHIEHLRALIEDLRDRNA